MKNIRKYFLTMIGLICLIPSLQAQSAPEQDPVQLYKNGLYGSLGFAGIYASATSNYERMVTQHFDKGITATFVKVGIGVYGVWGGSGSYYYAQYGFLTGKRASHLEISAGPNFGFNEDGAESPPIAATIGYRHQKPERHFILRTGLALPESIYLGIGWSFGK
ncbi:hypothetical protein JYB64_07165 [Algoriphagus aestuarii]|nr:hypothetical protein [Algoriphagus aestuarii]